jgi:hypothetical protein
MKKLISITALVVLAASGCAPTTAAPSGDATGVNRPSSSSSSSSAAPAAPAADELETEAPEPSDEDTELKFGQSATFDDGLVITVSKPKVFKPSEYAAFDKAKAYVKFTITVVNKTGKSFDPNGVYATVQSSNEEASSVFDSEKNIGGAPSTKLLKNREAKWVIGFGVQNPKDLVMEINPGAFEYDDVLYTN